MTVSTIQNLTEVVESKVTHDTKAGKSTILSWCCAEWRKIFAELLSTTILLMMGCMGSLPLTGLESSPIYTPLGFGMTVMFNIQIFGHISGAFMNPAVTIASVIFGDTSIPLGIVYIIVQCVGAIAGYGILVAVTSMDLAANAVCVTGIYDGQSSIQSVGIEIALTSVLMLLNCAIWDPANKHKLESVSIKFGLTILGLSVVGGPLTGASMNPARSLAPALWTNTWDHHWIYWVGPIIGGIIPTVLYKFVFMQKPKD